MKKVEYITKNFATQKISQEEVLPIKKSILQELEGNAKYIDVTISHVSKIRIFAKLAINYFAFCL